MNTLKIILVSIVLVAILVTAALLIGMAIASVRLFKNKEWGEGAFALFGVIVLGLMVVMEVLYWLP